MLGEDCVVEGSILLFAHTNMCLGWYDYMLVYKLGVTHFLRRWNLSVAHFLCRWMHMLIQVRLSYETAATSIARVLYMAGFVHSVFSYHCEHCRICCILCALDMYKASGADLGILKGVHIVCRPVGGNFVVVLPKVVYRGT